MIILLPIILYNLQNICNFFFSRWSYSRCIGIPTRTLITEFEKHQKVSCINIIENDQKCLIHYAADLSGNTVRPKASDFLKFAKLTICGILWTSVYFSLAMLNETFPVVFKHRGKNNNWIRCTLFYCYEAMNDILWMLFMYLNGITASMMMMRVWMMWNILMDEIVKRRVLGANAFNDKHRRSC